MTEVGRGRPEPETPPPSTPGQAWRLYRSIEATDAHPHSWGTSWIAGWSKEAREVAMVTLTERPRLGTDMSLLDPHCETPSIFSISQTKTLRLGETKLCPWTQSTAGEAHA